MIHNIIQKVEKTDIHLMEEVSLHPTLNNIEHAIEYITIIGNEAITYEARQN